jgi:uncharacterized membrane protein YesL
MTGVHPCYETCAQGFATAYAALVTNLLLAVACLPFLVVLLCWAPTRAWLALALLAPLCAPALCAAFAVFSTFSDDPAIPVTRTFCQAWRRSLRPALTVAAGGCALLVVLGVDVRAVWGRRIGALAIPFFVSSAVIVLAVLLLGLVTVSERPALRLRHVLRAAAFLAIRRWYATAMSLTVLWLLVAFVLREPALGLGIGTAPLLYVAWANSRHTLRPVLDTAAAPTAPTASHRQDLAA